MPHTHHITKPQKKKAFSLFTYYMILVGLSGPILTIPQLMNVWSEKHVEGLSLVSWAGYTVCAGSWLVYGIIHKERPIIISQLFLLPMEIFIVLGIYLYQ